MPEKSARDYLAERMLQARVDAGIDQLDAGARVGVSGAMWGHYERKERIPKPETIRRLPKAFHRSLNWFFGLPDERGLNEAEEAIISALRAIEDDALRAAAADAALRNVRATLEAARAIQMRKSQLESQSSD